VPAVGDRPVVGIGPGLYRRATSPHDTPAAARAFGAEALYQDAHNLVVEYAVTLGLLGLAAFGLWLVLGAAGARGELVWFAAFGALNLLVEPQFVGLTPVLALAYGAAARRGDPTVSTPLRAVGRSVAVVGVLVGLFGAGWLVRGDHEFERAVRDGCPSTARRAAHQLTPWPEPALYAASLETADRGCSRGGTAARAIEDVHTAIARDPSSPASWNTLGELEQHRGQARAARIAYERALRWNPESTTAMLGLARVAQQRGDRAEVFARCRKVHAVLPRAQCPPRGS
jgi:tetratricopeptide (TPR) repeat protein